MLQPMLHLAGLIFPALIGTPVAAGAEPGIIAVSASRDAPADNPLRQAGKIAFDSQASHERFQSIYIMNVDGSDRTRLTDGLAVARVPEFSCDGNKITFVSLRDGNYDIYVMNSDGTNLQRITTHPAKDSYPRFSPDGKWLTFFPIGQAIMIFTSSLPRGGAHLKNLRRIKAVIAILLFLLTVTGLLLVPIVTAIMRFTS